MRKVLYILSELDDSDVDWMVAHGSPLHCPAGSTLIREGESLEVLYVVLEGRLSVTLSALGGKEVACLRSGEVLGELSFLDSRPSSATVVAVDNSTVLSVPRGSLAAKLAADAAFAARFYRALGIFLASRLRRTQHRLGYGGDRILDEDVQHEDEVDPAMLDSLALAGARFDWMLKRLRGAGGGPPSA